MNTNFKDLTGQRFGRLLVLHRAEKIKDKERVSFICKCDCGKIKKVVGDYLQTGHTTSCGCFLAELVKTRGIIHGHSVGGKRTPEFAAWKNMISRCNNPKDSHYYLYGGRGIKICTRWQGKTGFLNFLFDMGKKPAPSDTLDRVKTNKNYYKSNCRWASHYTQARNKRNNIWIQYNGKKLVQSDWARKIGITPSMLHKLLNQGAEFAYIVEIYMPQLKRRPNRVKT